MKLLINEVYNLKIPPKDCSWLSLSKKLDKKSAPMELIDKYFKAFNDLIELRHLSSHRGIYNDAQKDEIEIEQGFSLYKHEANGYPLDEELKRLFPLIYIEYHIKNYKKERLKLLNHMLEANNNLLKEFLGSLYMELARHTK